MQFFLMGSSLVGLAVMVALIPVPAWFSTLMRGAQKAKMEAVRIILLFYGTLLTHVRRRLTPA
jgi:hypothetical protein